MNLPSARARRPTLLIVGCGDVGQRVLQALSPGWRVLALTTTAAHGAVLRARGAVPLIGDLDDAATLGRLGALADAVLHLAPPAARGRTDTRTRALVRALARAGRVRRLVYASTSGVYGDCQGARVDETRAVSPRTERAARRADAEAQARWFGRRAGVSVSILRIPGIYALDRLGGDPRERLRRGTPVLADADDVFTNHVHADDLARACIAALVRGAPQRLYHVCDDSELKMGAYFDLAADLWDMPRASRLSLEQARAQLGPTPLSFMGESRRLDNRRLKKELRLRLRYPTVREGLQRRREPNGG
jgi:nucleoside-diphosphate-sugar epimerase